MRRERRPDEKKKQSGNLFERGQHLHWRDDVNAGVIAISNLTSLGPATGSHDCEQRGAAVQIIDGVCEHRAQAITLRQRPSNAGAAELVRSTLNLTNYLETGPHPPSGRRGAVHQRGHQWDASITTGRDQRRQCRHRP